jgi:hypothetical protein
VPPHETPKTNLMLITDEVTISSTLKEYEIEDAFKQSRLEFDGSPEKFKRIVSAQDEHAKTLRGIRRSLRQVNQRHKEWFSVVRGLHGIPRVSTTTPGQSLIFSITADFDGIRRTFKGHKLSPEFELYEKYGEYVPKHLWRYIKEPHDEKTANFICRALNLLVTKIQRAARKTAFTRRVDDFERGAFKNYRSLMKYIARCFGKRTNMLVLRLDLEYQRLVEQLADGKGDLGAVTLPEIKRHRKMFQTELHRQFGEACIGFVWKLEFGTERGYHFHFLIMLDSSLHQQDVVIGRFLGECWRVITEGKGSYFNCNSQKQNYRYCALGRVHDGDSMAMLGLHYFACYVTLPDVFAQLILPGRDRAFGKGNMPDVNEKRVGRPRKRAEPLDVVRPTNQRQLLQRFWM